MIYVDDAYIPFRRMSMCHMIADSTAELLAMGRMIGIDPKWIQHPGTPKEHFDICKAMRVKAVAAGAKEITWREYGRMVRERLTA